MEVEPASKTEFEEGILKHQESDSKDISEINGNDDAKDIEIDVKLSESIKEVAKVNDNDETSKPNDTNETSEVLDNNTSIKSDSEINGNSVEDANISDIKPKDESFKAEEVEMDEVKDEPMDQDADPEAEQPPEFEDQDRTVKLEEPLFEETFIEGFAFCAFDKYTVLEECCKWSAQNPGKIPDPWYKLKFRPKEKPVKIKKEKKEKELTKKQKEKLEKASANSSIEKGFNCDTEKSDSEKASNGVSDPNFAKKSLNGVSPGSHPRPRPNGACPPGGQSGQPLNFSLPHSHPSPRYPAPSPQQQPRQSSGLYRPYESTPSAPATSHHQPRHNQPPPSHQNPAPRQIYSAPSTQGHHYNYPAPPGQQVHPAYRPPGSTTAGPAPAHHKGYPPQHHPQQHYYNRGYPGYPQYPGQQQHPSKSYPGSGHVSHHYPHVSNGVGPSHSVSSHPNSHQRSQTPSRDSYSSSYSSSSDTGSKHSTWPGQHSSSGYAGSSSSSQPSPVTGGHQQPPYPGSGGQGGSTLAPHSKPPVQVQPPGLSGPPSHPAASSNSLHRPDLDPRYLGPSERGSQHQPAPAGAGPQPPPSHYPPSSSQPPSHYPPASSQPPSHYPPTSQPPSSYPPSSTHPPSNYPSTTQPSSHYPPSSSSSISSHPPSGPSGQIPPHNSSVLPSTPMMKDVPKLGGPDSLFYRNNSRLSAPGLSGSSSHQFPASSQAGPGQPTPVSQHQTKKTGKWNAMHVRIAWEIYNHQQKAKTDAKSSVPSLRTPGSSFDLSGHKVGVAPGSDFTGKRPGPPQDLVRGGHPHTPGGHPHTPGGHSAQPNIFPPPGLPPPHNLHLDPYSAQRYYGTSHLGSAPMAAAAAASYPRYPSSAGPAPFGGLGGIIPSPAVSGSHIGARPPPHHPLTTSTPSSYPPASGLIHPGVSREREKEEADRRERERRHKEELEAARRDSEARASREGFPAYVRDRDRNGDTEVSHRDRSPVRPEEAKTGSSPSVRGGMEAVDLSSTNQRSAADLSSTNHVSSRPSSVVGGPPGQVKPGDPGGHLTKKEERICDDISIIAEKEGTRSSGRASVSSDHSITRINGGQPGLDPVNGLKSDSPAASVMKAGGHHGHPPTSYLYPGAQPRPGQPPGPPPASSYLASLAPPATPSHDPRSLAMFPHMMGQSLRPPNPLDPYAAAAAAAVSYPGLDPYRDPFRLDLLGRDPLREARERELMRLGSLGSLGTTMELERAKALSLSSAGYPSLAGAAYPGYPATTLAAAQAAASASLAAHKMGVAGVGVAPHLSSLYPATHPGYPPSLAGYPTSGLNGIPGHAAAGQYNGKDPLRR